LLWCKLQLIEELPTITGFPVCHTASEDFDGSHTVRQGQRYYRWSGHIRPGAVPRRYRQCPLQSMHRRLSPKYTGGLWTPEGSIICLRALYDSALWNRDQVV
jgi:hypothetical protein